MTTPNLFHTVLQADMHLPAPPREVFPLLCPLREAEWLPGWRAEILHSLTGHAELGCVFRTQDENGLQRIWTISRHEPNHIQFVQFAGSICIIRLDIELRSDPSGCCACWTYVVSALEAGHEDFFAAYEAEAFQARMKRLESLLAAYLGSDRRGSGL